MELSNETNELFAAFSMFQGELDNASKGKSGHGYKYADLAECINTAKPFLAKNGLAVTQLLGSNEEGKPTLTTMLTHKSGQYMSDKLVMVEAKLQGGGGKNPVQELGSAITYQRRYAYAAIIGLAQEDDDAASLTRKEENKRRASFSPDECLNQALKSISTADMPTLVNIWKTNSKALRSFPEHLGKLEAAKDVRKAELTPEA
ncbi:MAG: hypothetical protein GY928_36675 [Colwellia sp.]|nr:hypothetical protein [Colwellia sp.]